MVAEVGSSKEGRRTTTRCATTRAESVGAVEAGVTKYKWVSVGVFQCSCLRVFYGQPTCPDCGREIPPAVPDPRVRRDLDKQLFAVDTDSVPL